MDIYMDIYIYILNSLFDLLLKAVERESAMLRRRKVVIQSSKTANKNSSDVTSHQNLSSSDLPKCQSRLLAVQSTDMICTGLKGCIRPGVQIRD